jgi:hypothetical protein
VNDGQLSYEWGHLRAKLKLRSPDIWERWQTVAFPDPHPLFTVVDGPIAEWEKITSPPATTQPIEETRTSELEESPR